MNREEQIKAIYEKIADKTKNFWCKIERQWNYYIVIEWRHFIYEKTWKYLKTKSQSIEELSCESIWHPVMIWRCDLLIEKWPDYFDEWILILDLWEDKDKPIENQSERCIDHIYNLILVSWK